MSRDPDGLLDLLPAWHRIRDAESGEPLRALLAVIAEQADLIRTGIEQSYDDWFIETAADAQGNDGKGPLTIEDRGYCLQEAGQCQLQTQDVAKGTQPAAREPKPQWDRVSSMGTWESQSAIPCPF